MMVQGAMSTGRNELAVHARVYVHITKPGAYAVGCAQSLDGKTGTIEVSAEGVMWLVRFDTPADPWSSHQRPCGAFWFETCDLRILR